MALTRNGSRESGQATTEYILILFVMVSFAMIVMRGISDMGLMQKLSAPISGSFARAYQYGHPKGKGYDDGGPEFHPRAIAGGTNFRIFINPGKK